MPISVNCPHCQTSVEWHSSNRYRPFCSKKCQLIDLGEWAEEQKAIPCGANKDDELTQLPDVEDIEALLMKQDQDFFN